MTIQRKLLRLLLFISIIIQSQLFSGDDGYRLWLRYDVLSNPQMLRTYKQLLKGWMVEGESPTMTIVKDELQTGLKGLLGFAIPQVPRVKGNGIVIAGVYNCSSYLSKIDFGNRLKVIGKEGFVILRGKIGKHDVTFITANEEVGVLYGVFHFLRMLQTHQGMEHIDYSSSPKIQLRILNHWDNLNRTVERGYAGFSIWDWHKLPDYCYPQYRDYARANASIGINGTVLTNVNANALVLTHDYLVKVAALAKVFRPYGIKVYLTARFSAPIEIGGLNTADPLDPQVQQWWRKKVEEIYALVPDFGGFLVKANSEGQPGPQNYGRTHADGANMLADALQPFGGVVMWRAFVYDNTVPEDRAKQAYNEFKPLDGKFRNNVLIQVKNGPIDFQPREPFHPLFGALPGTPLMTEFQITQEYLGFSTHLVYLAPLFKECLDSDTYAGGQGSTVGKVIDGSLDDHALSGIAGVANTGTDRNWTGHLFGQANWYAFGRLAWNHYLTPEEIADEWIRMTFSNDRNIIQPIKTMMIVSREITVNYMTPLGLHHIMGWSHHYGPAPWIKDKNRDDWTSVYYHRADSNGIGFNRTETGSNAVSQYSQPVAQKFSSLSTCPDEYLLWFHHLSWNYQMKSGRTLWEELCLHYYDGVNRVRQMLGRWNALEGKIDGEQFHHVQQLLKTQVREAVWWRNACVLYFQAFSRQPIPDGLEKPDTSLEYYQRLSFPYAPGN
ncbi:MAG: alpha-glucuronidase family glycosyl hydrolase [bacterium]